MNTDPLDTVFLVENTQNLRFGTRWVFEKDVPSTNDLARDMILKGTPEGTVIVAESQSRGKGRQGRTWESIHHAGIYLSTLLYPPNPVQTASWLTLITGIAAVDALSPWCYPTLKWPNDLLINERKIGGILCEYIPEATPSPAVIIGIGLNVHQEPRDFPEELRTIATSITQETNSEPNRTTIIQKLLERLDEEYNDFLQTGTEGVVSRWSERTLMFGKKVTLSKGAQSTTGVAKRLDEAGHLVIETEVGEVSFSAGEVTISKF